MGFCKVCKKRARKALYAAEKKVGEYKDEVDRLTVNLEQIIKFPWNSSEHREKQQKKENDSPLHKFFCPYCLSEHETKELLFRVDYSEDGNGEGFPEEKDEEFDKFYTHRPCKNIPLGEKKKHILNRDLNSGEIKKIVFDSGWNEAQNETVYYNIQDRERMNQNRVVCVIDKFNHRTYDRICPQCHNLLPPDIGFCPNFIYPIMGNSYSGKTVYLHRLALSVLENKFMRLFDEDARFFHGMVVSKDSREYGNSFAERAEAMFSQQDKPLTDPNDVEYIPPLILRLENSSTHEKFMVTLFDYPGEALWNNNNQTIHYNKYSDDIRQIASGLIIMLDSGAILSHAKIDVDKKHFVYSGRNPAAKAAAGKIITKIHESHFNKEPIKIPVAFVLSKSDLIEEYKEKLKEKFTAYPWDETSAFLDERAAESNDVKMDELYRCHTMPLS